MLPPVFVFTFYLSDMKKQEATRTAEIRIKPQPGMWQLWLAVDRDRQSTRILY